MARSRSESTRRQRLTAGEAAWLAAVARSIRDVEPSAEVILFGSRARGDAVADSDWDILVVLDAADLVARRDTIRARLAGLDAIAPGAGSGLSVTCVSAAEWTDPIRRTWPLLANVRREGLHIRLTDPVAPRPAIRLHPIAPEVVGMPRETEPLVRHQRDLAREALQAAELAAGAELWSTCVNRLYYVCFYIVSAWLIQRGLSSPRHTGIRALFNQHLVRTGLVAAESGRLYNDLFENRHRADYEPLTRFAGDQVRPWLGEVRRFLADVERLIETGRED